MKTKLTKYNFWDTDLSDIESIFLPKNKKITDLNISMNDNVPSQGSVLLNKVVNNDRLIKPVNFIQKINYFLFNKKN